MKKPVVILSLLLASFAALAQQPQPGDSYWKSHWKSVLRKEKLPPAHVTPVPYARDLPGEQLDDLLKNMVQSLDIISLGDSLRIAKLDRMPVLILNLKQVEKMPGSHPYTPAPPSKMPNPLYPRKKWGHDF